MTDFQELDRALARQVSQGVCRDDGTRHKADHGQALGEDSCQNELLPDGTNLIARGVVLVKQVGYYLRNRGLVPTIKRVTTFLASAVMPKVKVKRGTPGVRDAAGYVEVLNLKAGDWVEVKSEADIRQTLDSAGRNRGLTFTPEMREYCGKRLRVLKRVRQICMETRPNEMRRLENTVILEGAFCNGGSRSCDRACFFFWREAWLQPSSEPARDVTAERTLVKLKVL